MLKPRINPASPCASHGSVSHYLDRLTPQRHSGRPYRPRLFGSMQQFADTASLTTVENSAAGTSFLQHPPELLPTYSSWSPCSRTGKTEQTTGQVRCLKPFSRLALPPTAPSGGEMLHSPQKRRNTAYFRRSGDTRAAGGRVKLSAFGDQLSVRHRQAGLDSSFMFRPCLSASAYSAYSAA